VVTTPAAAATEAEEAAKKEEEEDVGIVRHRTHAVAISVALPSRAAAALARHTCDPGESDSKSSPRRPSRQSLLLRLPEVVAQPR
jgi:hypothetical protein